MERKAYGTAYTAPDRGECAECGRSVLLALMTGYVRRHGDCSGGGRPPVRVKETVTVELPEVEKVRHE